MHFRAKDIINEKYTVVFPIKQGAYAETYRVKDNYRNRYFFKLIDESLVSKQQRNDDGTIKEIEIIKMLDHPNLPHFIDEGTINKNGKKFTFFITDFISSETVADRLMRANTLSVHHTKTIIRGILEALKYLHQQPDPIVHNEVTALNTLIDLTTNDISKVVLIDFGHSCYESEAIQQNIEGLNWFYLAPECFDGVSTPQSDLYAVGALMYQLVFGMLPWYCDLSNVAPERRKHFILKQKDTELLIPLTNKFEMDERLLNIMRKALAADLDERFENAEQFIEALKGNINVTAPSQHPATASDRSDAFSARHKDGNGFADVAGMDNIKQMLLHDVINRLRDPEKAKRYKLQIPNGILFYGPPGCGKSFLAEKFAEEAGYNFKMIKASDLASIYVHGAQEKIGALFDEARKNSPTILCFDEFDALVPTRGGRGVEHQSGEVNEFLSQLNNCGEHGVFVIASTNRPDIIDPAILRKGRIDKVIFIPMPDEKARERLFEIHLQGRPFDSGINYAILASLTKNYIASDIAYIINEAASRAADTDSKISQDIIEEIISQNKPSLSQAAIDDYNHMREKMENIVEPRRRVGF